jgi:flagellar assembly protein FliH
MTSSPSRAPAAPKIKNLVTNLVTNLEQPAYAVSPFRYREVTVLASQPGCSTQPGQADPQSSVAQEAEREAQARESGRLQGERESRAKFEEQLGRERSALAKALQEFAVERAAYYQNIEREAVQLALGIARKVLHREAQVDPLLLMGVVRVALERIEGATGVVLAVHPQQAAEWRRYLASHMDSGDLPEIVEDPTLALEQCQLRTSMGTAELGLEIQLKEIEQGLMDLLAARPQQKEKS